MEDLRRMVERMSRGSRTAVVTVRLSNEILKKLDRIAKRKGKSRNELINMYMEFAISNLRGDGKQPP